MSTTVPKMRNGHLLQYHYSSCGKILNESSTLVIPNELLTEECPGCGASLSITLQNMELSPPLSKSQQVLCDSTPKQNGQDQRDNINTITMRDDRTRLQALSLINDCYKYIMDLTTNGVVIIDAIKLVQTKKEKLTMSAKEDDNGKESKEPDYNEDEEQLEEKQEEETGEIDQETTTNKVF